MFISLIVALFNIYREGSTNSLKLGIIQVNDQKKANGKSQYTFNT